jgi:CHAT domain-containing protein
VEKISDNPVNPDTQFIYHFLKQNIDKLDDDLIKVLENWTQETFLSSDTDKVAYIACIIFSFSRLIQEFPLGDVAINKEIAITGYKNVLSIVTFDTFPEDWAGIQNNLAAAYIERIRENKEENLEQSITYCNEAFTFKTFTSKAFPEQWARMNITLGAAYRHRIRGNKAENIEQAIFYYQEALKVYNFDDAFRSEWAKIQNNLGEAYCDRIRGNKAENIEQAIFHCQEALKVYNFDDAFLYQQAVTQNNLALAYSYRIRGDKKENIEQAILYYQEILKVLTININDYPEDWAMIQHNLALAYDSRIKGDREKNIEQAILYYKAAIQVRTIDNFPYDWAITINNLGQAYCNRIEGDKGENIEQAICYYQKTLEVFASDTYLYNWAMTQKNLAAAYFFRKKGNKTENIKEAIKYFHNALTIYTKEDYPIDCLEVAQNLGVTHYINNQWQSATEAYHLAIEALENVRLESFNLQNRQETLSNNFRVFHHIVLAHLMLNQPSKALEYIERSKAQNLVELMTQKNVKPHGVDQATIDKLNELRQKVVNEQIRLQHQSINQNISRNYNSIPYVQDYSYLKDYRQKLDEFIDQKITPSDSNFKLTQKVQPIPFEDIQSLTDQSTCLLQWYITSEKVLAFVVSSDGEIKCYNSSEDDKNKLIYDINNYLNLYYSENGKQEWMNQLPTLLQNFAATLHINDILALISDTCQRLIIIPYFFLHILPLHALPIDDNRILQDKYDIQYAPSCQLLQIIQQPLLNELSSLFAIKNPTKDLIYTELEVNIISALFNDKIIIPQDEATKDIVTTHPKLSDSHCHHFSCHGVFNSQNPLESALILAHKKNLRLGEIFELNLKKSRLVVLSACETGLIDLNSLSDEYLGLPSSFLFAGSPSVVSSLWTVNDLSTSFLMMKFYEILPKNPNRGEVAICLKNAQNWLRNLTVKEFELELEKMDPQINQFLSQLRKGQQSIFKESLKQIRQRQPYPFKEPYYWAGFCSVGF